MVGKRHLPTRSSVRLKEKQCHLRVESLSLQQAGAATLIQAELNLPLPKSLHCGPRDIFNHVKCQQYLNWTQYPHNPNLIGQAWAALKVKLNPFCCWCVSRKQWRGGGGGDWGSHCSAARGMLLSVSSILRRIGSWPEPDLRKTSFSWVKTFWNSCKGNNWRLKWFVTHSTRAALSSCKSAAAWPGPLVAAVIACQYGVILFAVLYFTAKIN